MKDKNVSVIRYSYYLPQLNSNILQFGEDIEFWVILEFCVKLIYLDLLLIRYYLRETKILQ